MGGSLLKKTYERKYIMQGYIERKKAAAILGVEPQTISNYADSGLIEVAEIRLHDWGRCKKLYKESDVMKILEKNVNILEKKHEVDEYLQMLENEREALIQEVKQTHDMRELRNRFMTLLPSFLKQMSEILDVGFQERDMKALLATLNGETIEDLNYGVSSERMRQIYERFLKRMDTCVIRRSLDEFAEMKKLNAVLQQDNTRLKAAYSSMESFLAEQNRVEDFYKSCFVPEGMAKLLNRPIHKCGFSFRTEKCLRSQCIANLADLVSYGEKNIMRIRNLGKVSLKEIHDYLESQHLSFSINPTDYGFRKVTTEIGSVHYVPNTAH